MRGETRAAHVIDVVCAISIHSPHARGDQYRRNYKSTDGYFNPLPSCEGRRLHVSLCRRNKGISIHSPHARGDPMRSCIRPIDRDFNPLPSCEGRPLTARPSSGIRHFNPLPSCEGRQIRPRIAHNIIIISIHSPHARGDLHAYSHGNHHYQYFNPLPSCEGRLVYL